MGSRMKQFILRKQKVELGKETRDGTPIRQFMDLSKENLDYYPQPPPWGDSTVRNSFRTFKSLSSQSSMEQADPAEARAWLKEIEESFEILNDWRTTKDCFCHLPS